MAQLINVNYATGSPAQLLNDPTVPGIQPAQFDADPASGALQVALVSDPTLNPTKYILAAGVAVSGGGSMFNNASFSALIGAVVG